VADQNKIDFLQQWAQKLTDEIRDNLVSKDTWFDRSQLAQSIVALPVETTSGGFVVKIGMADYGQFVDEGRDGSDRMPPIEPIEDWITRRGIPTPLVLKIQRKSKMITRRFANTLEARRSMAFGIANKIQERGFFSKGYGFYSEVITEQNLTKLSESLAERFGEEYVAEIVED
jgi:hypothetical protein